MNLVLNESNIVLVNSLRNAALKSSSDFNVIKFFADFEYAKACLAKLATSGVPELASLASKANEHLFSPTPQVTTREVGSEEQVPLGIDLVKLNQQAENLRPFIAAKELVNSMVVDAIGLRSLFFVLKLERCDSAGALVALMPAFQKLIAKGVGDDAAAAMAGHVRSVL